MKKLSFSKYQEIKEASYPGNIGFEEMVRFFQKANDQEEQEMEKILKKNDFSAFKRLIKKVLGVTLK